MVGSRLPAPNPAISGSDEEDKDAPAANFGVVLFVILLPIILIVIKTCMGLITGDAPWLLNVKLVFSFIGEPWVALLISTLVATVVLGIFRNFKMEQLQNIMSDSLKPVATILLVTAAGGVLRYILDYSGAGTIIGGFFEGTNIPIVLAAFIITTLIRIAIGSGSVACAMGGGIIAAMPQIAAMSPLQLAVLAIAIAAGAFSFSHVNDSGFWMFKEFLGIEVKPALKGWLAYSCSLGVVMLVVSLILFQIV